MNTAWRKSSLLMGEEEDKSRKKDKLDKMALTLMGKSRCKIHFKQERRVLLDACHCPLAEPSTRTWLKHGFLALWSLGASLTVPSFLCCLFCQVQSCFCSPNRQSCSTHKRLPLEAVASQSSQPVGDGDVIYPSSKCRDSSWCQAYWICLHLIKNHFSFGCFQSAFF